MEEICERENCRQALARVQANQGSPGVDGMTVQALPGYLQDHWVTIRDQLVRGTYVPQPVKRVEIPKPDGGVRKLGIPVDEGAPQGGPLSPLLSNIVLDEFDRELERRGLRFARYADDCNIYGRSRRAGQRVMASLTRFLTTKLKLKVNEQKSAVARPWERKFLGFRFTAGREPKRRIAPKAIGRFKERVRELTRRTRGVSIERMAEDLTRYLRGWLGSFGRCQTPSVLAALEAWLRRRLRSALWKQWKRGTVRFAELRKRGVSNDLAAQTAGSAHDPWHLANSPALAIALPNAYFDSLGIPRLTIRSSLNPPNRRMRTRMYGGVTGKAGDRLPMSIPRRYPPLHASGIRLLCVEQAGICLAGLAVPGLFVMIWVQA